LALRQETFQDTKPVPLWTRDFVLICLANGLMFAGFQMAMPTLSLFAEQLGVEERLVGLVTGVFTIAAVTVRPFVGRALDQRGRRGLYLAGLLGCAAFALAYQWAPVVWMLLLLRLGHGLNWGLTGTAAGTIVADMVPAHRRGEGIGYFGMSATLAMAIGPAIGLGLVISHGFAAVYTLSAALTLMALVLAWHIRVPQVERRPQGKTPLFEGAVWLPAVVSFFLTLSYGAVVTYLPLHAKELGITNIGPFYTVYAITLLVVRPISGILFDRRGPVLVVTTGMLAVVVSLLIMAGTGGMGGFLVAGFFNGIGFGAVQPSLMALAVKSVPANRRGAANGTLFGAFDLGIGLGAVLLGLVVGLAGYTGMYLVAAISAALGLVLFHRYYDASL